ncbi:hypothetical protein VULLAG_LOCUS18418 [Vulpes lagopus]
MWAGNRNFSARCQPSAESALGPKAVLLPSSHQTVRPETPGWTRRCRCPAGDTGGEPRPRAPTRGAAPHVQVTRLGPGPLLSHRGPGPRRPGRGGPPGPELPGPQTREDTALGRAWPSDLRGPRPRAPGLPSPTIPRSPRPSPRAPRSRPPGPGRSRPEPPHPRRQVGPREPRTGPAHPPPSSCPLPPPAPPAPARLARCT